MQPKSFIKTLSLIHAALLMGLVAFGLFAYFQNGDFEARMNRHNPMIYVVPIAAAAGYFLSQFLFRKRLRSVNEEEPLSVKLEVYRSASLIKYALLEAAALLSLVAYWLSGNALHLVIAIALAAYFFSQRPTATKIKKDLPLNYEEQKLFTELK